MCRSSFITEVYRTNSFFLHAALLGQGSPHCRKFPTAASRRSLGRVSVPVWPVTLSGRLRIVALVGRYPSNKLMRRLCTYAVLADVSISYPPVKARLLTYYSPVRHSSPKARVRLACIRHAASVHPEPGSNSPLSYPFQSLSASALFFLIN